MAARLLSLTPILIYLVFCTLGVAQFRLWSQVTYIHAAEFSAFEILADYHGLRYLLVLPIFLISEWTGIAYDRLFSLIVPLLIFIVSWFTQKTVEGLEGKRFQFEACVLFAAISVFFILLSMFMNGRLMFAMCGSAVLLWALLGWDRNSFLKNLAAVLAAIMLCSVSTGTFFMVVMTLYFFLAVRVIADLPQCKRRGELLVYALLLVVLSPYLTMLVLKVVEYFGGDFSFIFHTLGHGYGLALERLGLVVLLPAAMLLIWLLFLCRETIVKYWIISSFIGFCLLGGVFGISTAMIVLPPLLVASILVALKLIENIAMRALPK